MGRRKKAILGTMAMMVAVPAMVIPVQNAVNAEAVEATTPMVAGDKIEFAGQIWDVYDVTSSGQARLMSQKFLPKHEKVWRSDEFLGILDKKINTVIPDADDRAKLVKQKANREPLGILHGKESTLGMMNETEFKKYKDHIELSTVSDTALFTYVRISGTISEDSYGFVTPDGTVYQGGAAVKLQSRDALVRPTIVLKKEESHKTSDGKQSSAVDAPAPVEHPDYDLTNDMFGDLQIIKYKGNEKDVVIPSHINGRKVTSIGYNYDNSLKMLRGAFESRALTSVVIPEGVERIEWSAFENNNLTSIEFPSSLKSISIEAFKDNAIEELIIPEGVTELNSESFKGNNITKVTFPSTLTDILDSAFDGNNLTKIVIPDTVTKIGSLAFANNKITDIEIPESVTSAPDNILNGNQFVNSYLTVWGKGGTRAHAIALANGFTFNEGKMEIPKPEEPTDMPDWSFDNPDAPFAGGKPTVTITGGKAVQDILLDDFDWVSASVTVATANGDIELTPKDGGTMVSIPDGLGDKNTNATIKVEHEGQHFLTIKIKPVPKLDFNFGI